MTAKERLDEVLTWDLIHNCSIERIREIVLEACEGSLEEVSADE